VATGNPKREHGHWVQERVDPEIKRERAYIFELDEAEVAEVGDGEVRGLGGDDDLHQVHGLGAHQIHGRAAPAGARHGRDPRRGSGGIGGEVDRVEEVVDRETWRG
jgi:hypothetical protein